MKGVLVMGMAKQAQIEKDQNERECPECDAIVQVNWSKHPNVHCESCEQDYDVKQCENCTNLIHLNDESIVCSDCIGYGMRD
jgi:RecJ-like exonuclease